VKSTPSDLTKTVTSFEQNNKSKGDIMSVHKSDLEELRRMATNCYDDEKKFLNRVIMGIGLLESENRKLKAENEELKTPKIQSEE
jgi:hypothetical protein